MKKEKLYGFLALPRSYFSLSTSPSIALMVSLLTGLNDLYVLAVLGVFFFLSTAFLNSYNNLIDAKADALTKDRFPIPLGLVTLREAAAFSAAVFAAASVIAYLIYGLSSWAGFLAYVNLALNLLYSTPGIRLKRYPLVKGGTLVAHTLLIPFTMANLILGHSVAERLGLLIPLFLIGLGVHTIQDIGDVRGDVLMGDRTIPIILGVKKSVMLSLALIISAAALLTVYQTPLRALATLLIAVQVPPLLYLLVREDVWKQVFWLCSIMSAGVVASLLYECCG